MASDKQKSGPSRLPPCIVHEPFHNPRSLPARLKRANLRANGNHWPRRRQSDRAAIVPGEGDSFCCYAGEDPRAFRRRPIAHLFRPPRHDSIRASIAMQPTHNRGMPLAQARLGLRVPPKISPGPHSALRRGGELALLECMPIGNIAPIENANRSKTSDGSPRFGLCKPRRRKPTNTRCVLSPRPLDGPSRCLVYKQVWPRRLEA